MRRIFFVILMLVFSGPLFAQVGIGTVSPDPSAVLDLTSSNKGLLVPRVLSHSAIISPAEGLIVYDLTTHSHWFFQDEAWMSISNPLASEDYWHVAGNTGNLLSHFLGTLDTVPVRFKVNNVHSGIIDYNTGNVAFGYRCFNSGLGSNNVAIGANTLESLVTGSNNVAVGSNAGHLNLGAGNVFLGSNAGSDETGSNKLYISNSSTPSPLIWGDFANNILSTPGQMGIGTQTPTAALEVKGMSPSVRITHGPGPVNGSALLFADTNGDDLIIASGGSFTGINFLDNAGEIKTAGLSLKLTAHGIEDQLFLNNDGYIGIGTNAPESKLHIVGPVGESPLRIESLQRDDVSANVMVVDDKGVVGFNPTIAQPVLWGRNLAPDYTYLYNANDKLCIGTTATTEKVNVDGNILITHAANGLARSIYVAGQGGGAGNNGSDLKIAAGAGSPQIGGSNLYLDGGLSSLYPGNVLISSTATGSVGIRTASPTSSVTLNGSVGYSLVNVSGAYTVTDNNNIIVCTGDVTASLPSAIGIAGRQYTFKRTYRISMDHTSINPMSGQTIDEASTYDLTSQWQYVTIVSDGTNWLVISKN